MATKLLSAQEEVELAIKIKGGDRNARERLFLSNQRLVGSIAKRYQGRGIDLEDLVAYGAVGLLKACDSYDPVDHPGIRFSTHATHWILREIKYSIYEYATTVRVPSYMAQIRDRYRAKRNWLRQEKGREVSFEEVAPLLETSGNEVAHLRYALQPARANSEPFCVVEENWQSIDTKLDFIEIWSKATDLTDLQRFVLVHRCGLEGECPKTMKEIGKMLGIGKEAVNRIGQRAVGRFSRFAS